MSKARWAEYPNFTDSEFNCKHTGWNEMQHEFMTVLQAIREEYDKPIGITSGYRHPSHPVEIKKGHANGEHTKGLCADISCDNGADRFMLVQLALKHGITRIGIAKTFLHLGIGGNGLPQNVIWEYA
jgi:uncharacterized protein YcbK (DUF882 family)